MDRAGWQWWAGSGDECYTVGPCDSRDDAISEATGECLGEFEQDGEWKLSFHICEARKDPLNLSDWIMDIDELLERAEESVGDSDRASEYDDPPYFDCTKEQQADLERRIKLACDDWQKAHGLVFTTWTFSASRNHEQVVVDHPL